MTTVGYQLQFHHAIEHDPYDLGHLLRQLRHHLPQTARLHHFTQAEIDFEAAYHRLDPSAAQLLRSLGLLVQPCFSSAIAAVLLDCEVEQAAPAIQQLIQVGLLDPVSPTWYCFVNESIQKKARSYLLEDAIEFRHSARLRIIRWYLELCEQMSLCLDPATRFQIALAARKGNSFVATLSTGKRSESVAQSLFLLALDWFDEEKSNLIWAIDESNQVKAWETTLRLTQSLVRFFDVKADWRNWEHTHLFAWDAAQMLGDRIQQAQILNSLGNVYLRQGQWKRAQMRYDRALNLCREQNLTVQEAQTLVNLGIVHRLEGQTESAIDHWKSAIEIFPSGSIEREKISKWMQSPTCLPLQTALEELGTSANSHQILNAVGGAIRWLLHPGGLYPLW
ncbi:tetratricopeptide repeat protein [Pseudanabaenaceae cyanobacterium LEGE 13415]|nr:tetratricopeptide repeat protein [Pseudanabaenaceae cyanobacterium LEGE 13415]